MGERTTGLPILFTGLLLYMLDYGGGEHGLVLQPDVGLRGQGSQILFALPLESEFSFTRRPFLTPRCWVDLMEADRIPGRIFVVTFSLLFAFPMVTTESTAIFATLYPIPQPHTDWLRMADAELDTLPPQWTGWRREVWGLRFAYTGMYPIIILSLFSHLSTLTAFTLSVMSKDAQGSAIFFGSLSLGINIAFGSTLFFYHSFANARVAPSSPPILPFQPHPHSGWQVRRVILEVRSRLAAIGSLLKRGGGGTVSPGTEEEGVEDDADSAYSRSESAYSGYSVSELLSRPLPKWPGVQEQSSRGPTPAKEAPAVRVARFWGRTRQPSP